MLTELKTQNANNNLKLYYVVCYIYVGAVLAAITTASRLISINIYGLKVYITGGTLIISIAFFLQAIITEVYGYSYSKKSVQLASVFTLLVILIEYLITLLPVPSREFSQVTYSYNAYFTSLPRHIIAYIAAIYAGNLTTDFLVSKWKVIFAGNFVATRFIVASAIGEAISISFAFLSWYGYMNVKRTFF